MAQLPANAINAITGHKLQVKLLKLWNPRILQWISLANDQQSVPRGACVGIVSHANTNSSRVVMAACSSFVSIVFSRTQLDRFFDTAEDIPGAVNMVLDG